VDDRPNLRGRPRAESSRVLGGQSAAEVTGISAVDPERVPIRAVVFDLGGTLEDIYYDDHIRREATRGLQALLLERGLDPGLTLPDLHVAIQSGLAAYQRWREETNLELPPERVWAEFIFADRTLPIDRLAAAAEDLTLYYENHAFVRALRPEAPEVLATLRDHGLRLAVISNTVSRALVPRNLAAYGIAHFFEPVVASSAVGYRKPHPHIFLKTAKMMHLPPTACAYVGDTVSRDVAGARRAGYGLTIQIRSFLTDRSDRETDTDVPDAVIHTLREVPPLVTGAALSGGS